MGAEWTEGDATLSEEPCHGRDGVQAVITPAEEPPGRRQSDRKSEDAGQCPTSKGSQGEGYGMDTQAEKKPVEVPDTSRTKQTGEVQRQWAWTEASVWTDRMLATLENGVKGNVWFSLIDKVWRLENLRAGYEKVKGNGGAAGVDRQTVKAFGEQADKELMRLSEEIRTGTYRMSAIKRTYIPKPGSDEKRPLGIPTVRDRVVETALRHVIEPIFERTFADCSYGSRPGRSAHEALAEVERLLNAGYGYVVDIDLKRYFDTIPRNRLMARVRERIADGRVLQMLEEGMAREVDEEGQRTVTTAGTPQGSVISPLLANVYLNSLDHSMQAKGYRIIRYMDDAVVLCQTLEEAEAALREISGWVKAEGLELNAQKTRLVNLNQPGEGFDFLGYHIQRTQRGTIRRWPRDKSLKKMTDRIRELTPRNSGKSLIEIIGKTNRTTRGWYAYFRYSIPSTFARMDSWIRQRLRSILRRRRKRKGRARGYDHQRWPNDYFAELGLFSMVAAHAR